MVFEKELLDDLRFVQQNPKTSELIMKCILEKWGVQKVNAARRWLIQNGEF